MNISSPMLAMCRHRPRRLLVAVGLLWAAQAASAIGFSVLVSDNTSSANTHTVASYEAEAFRSTLAWSAPTLVQGAAVATHRAAWSVGRASYGNDLILGQTDKQLSYTVGFRIEDPDRLGYRLDVMSLLRGYFTAETASLSVFVSMTGVAMSASVDSGTGFAAAPALDTSSQSLTFIGGNRSVNTLFAEQATLDLGSFAGSRDFAIRFVAADHNLRLRLDMLGTGQVGLRFGLNPGLAELNQIAYPGLDGEPASEHGHFLTVRATYNLAPVPEPTTWALLAGGLAGLLWRRRFAGSLS
jgi:PEP-CTERM motif